VILRSLWMYWTEMLWNSGMISLLASVYSTLQFSPRHSTDVGQWNGWWLYHSPLWRVITILSMSTFWSCPSTSPLSSSPQSSSSCVRNTQPKLGIPKYTDTSLSEVNWILLHMQQAWVSLKWCTCCDTGRKNDSFWQW
jgi:hypothetical protein